MSSTGYRRGMAGDSEDPAFTAAVEGQERDHDSDQSSRIIPETHIMVN
ncbi:hypothetical protein A1F94_007508 [Pyrenophora tritici-repentis]|uniref:Uncharacterized protein n=1 Tax=Pyrenophora tritici-repentis TaxID=45151 RepID=A0A5M9KVP9_9PLEO|nr:hypothetical protein PtrV1_10158 [Pyrenophora tritici-repentis]KAF7446147.1 hypothetical protein A1F99_094380 [Pyrenophora tritici-repentis]KAF7567253.1 hypothetical protein PtrM4_138440 [Pyrenophora tritici-repentis]KAG9381854.1 hypothetical protein A1F94_007508 [Pyrenophora tritici-repentis]KAI0583365.1 hypothetical protein Alg130_05704 [Pyrenophora tritici-repentis]